MRYKQVKTGSPNGTETTLYVGKAYEEIHYNGSVQKKLYLGDAIITEQSGGSNAGNRIAFVHRDRLGSVVTLTDQNGNVIENRSYDPFGKPRLGTFANASQPKLFMVAYEGGYLATPSQELLYTRRGFTDHEHLDDAELIHMNERAYDYKLRRFLSVDPFIQSPGNSQSMNPYSYIMNNPLAGTDPSGYVSQTDVKDKVTTKVIKVSRPGSRIKDKLTVKLKDSGGNGTVDAIDVAGSNGAAVTSAVIDIGGKAQNLSRHSKRSSAVEDIGSQESVAQQKGKGTDGGSPSQTTPNYFAIHSTAGRINDSVVEKYKEDKIRTQGHIYIKENGELIVVWPMSERDVRATKTEWKSNNPEARGDIVHIELIYARGGTPSDKQYEALADLYIEASKEFDKNLTIVPHKEIDRGLKNGHSDPENFDFNKLYDILKNKGVDISKVP